MDPPPSFSSATPPRRSEAWHRTKPTAPPASVHYNGGVENHPNGHDCGNCSSSTPPPSKTRAPISPSPLHLSIRDHAPLRELLLLSPSPRRKPKSSRRLRLGVENVDPDEEVLPRRRRSKSQVVSDNVGLMGCASPRGRLRRRVEKEREKGVAEEIVGKAKGMRRRKEESLSLAALVDTSDPSPKGIINEDNQTDDLEGGWNFISELVTWKDVAKSSLWFGFGCLCFISSCFSKNLSLNFISLFSHVGLFILALAFLYDSFSKRCEDKRERQRIQLKEEDILGATRLVLPKANAAIAMTQDVFSGEASMTLKVAPALLFAAKYGNLITLWRLCAVGFFVSFTVPKLYLRYSHQIQRLAVDMSSHVCETWKACQHKRVAALSAVTLFWNMFDVKTRILAAFIAIVIIRYNWEFCKVAVVDEGKKGGRTTEEEEETNEKKL